MTEHELYVRQRARLAICERAADVEDARLLIDSLGLMSDDVENAPQLLPNQLRATGTFSAKQLARDGRGE